MTVQATKSKKTKTAEAFDSQYDGSGPTRKGRVKGAPALLVEAEDLRLFKVPAVVSNELAQYAALVIDAQPQARDALTAAQARAKAAPREQREADALAVIEAKGTPVLSPDLVAEAEAQRADAARMVQAVSDATAGSLRYMSQLVGGDQYAPMLERLDKAWASEVLVTPTQSTTLGQLAELEARSNRARKLIQDLAAWLENSRNGEVSLADRKRLREAFDSGEWEVVPTLDRIAKRDAEVAANSPEGQAAEARAKARAKEQAENAEYAKANAAQRLAERRPKNSDGDPVVG